MWARFLVIGVPQQKRVHVRNFFVIISATRNLEEQAFVFDLGVRFFFHG